MAESLADQIMLKINQASQLYHRLLLVVGPVGSGKTLALQAVADRTGAPLLNVNLELSRLMLELTERQRALQLPGLLRSVVDGAEGDTVLLDNTEVLFDVDLKQDPLRLLQSLSRSRTIVAAWNGGVVQGSLVYATPDHPEYRHYPVRDFLVASPEEQS